jgi:hypothetical protein
VRRPFNIAGNETFQFPHSNLRASSSSIATRFDSDANENAASRMSEAAFIIGSDLKDGSARAAPRALHCGGF